PSARRRASSRRPSSSPRATRRTSPTSATRAASRAISRCRTPSARPSTPSSAWSGPIETSYSAWCASTRRWAAAGRSSAPSVLVGDDLVGVVGLAVAASLLPLRQLDLLGGQRLVRDLAEQVGDDVEPRAALVVGGGDEPRRPGRVGLREHLVAGPRVV